MNFLTRKVKLKKPHQHHKISYKKYIYTCTKLHLCFTEYLYICICLPDIINHSLNSFVLLKKTSKETSVLSEISIPILPTLTDFLNFWV